ncbi:Ger(x)C family spore germination protein [Mangrovibacillus cuniculi]|uniref:Ger(X)C family spore germination protein n=1 Tax=Mangrovibacillus cuniculi TaxID=2593652 RepID=A0A7S8HG55_9BACI|nr:Ger(x)C family spore germination protein [Mangrovibacillus cuniculi]QPC47422.1 Ger(x)C family spore germination protein [Mangrovibacillus cuniculi]
MKKNNLPLLLLLFVFLSGCVKQEVIDELNVESIAGYDVGSKPDKILGTVSFPIYQADKSVENIVLSDEAVLSRELLSKLDKQSSQPLVTGSLRVVLFGEKLVTQGILPLVDSLQRDSSIGSRMYLAIAKPEAGTLLKGKYGRGDNGTYVSNLISHNMNQRDVPKSNLHVFLRDYYQRGKTPFLPILTQVGDGQLEISEIGLLDADKLVDTIPLEDMFFFKVMVDQFSEGSQLVEIEEGEATVRSINSRYKFTYDQKKSNEFKIDITLRGIIREYSGKLLTQKEIEKLEKNLNDMIHEKCTKLVNKFLELNIDPLGLGYYAKTSSRGFDWKEWEDNYQNLTISVSVDGKIIEAGTIE